MIVLGGEIYLTYNNSQDLKFGKETKDVEQNGRTIPKVVYNSCELYIIPSGDKKRKVSYYSKW